VIALLSSTGYLLIAFHLEHSGCPVVFEDVNIMAFLTGSAIVGCGGLKWPCQNPFKMDKGVSISFELRRFPRAMTWPLCFT
jgi:hypothetical protein